MSCQRAIVVITGRAHHFFHVFRFTYVGKAKTKFRLRFNNYKSKHRSFRKGKQNVPQKRFHSHYIQDCHRGIDDWEVTLFEKCKTSKQLK